MNFRIVVSGDAAVTAIDQKIAKLREDIQGFQKDLDGYGP